MRRDPVERTNRFFLIFEAAVDNPDPQNRPEGCLGIARFWDSLKGKTGQEPKTALEKFYYEGDTNGDGTPDIQPVIHHQHFGLPFGQVRVNLFVTGRDIPNNPWMLREWRVSVSPDGSAVFVPDTVKANPNPALYGSAATNEVAGFGDLRFDFQDDFVRIHVRELIETELRAQKDGKTPTPTELFEHLAGRQRRPPEARGKHRVAHWRGFRAEKLQASSGIHFDAAAHLGTSRGDKLWWLPPVLGWPGDCAQCKMAGDGPGWLRACDREKRAVGSPREAFSSDTVRKP